MNVRVVSGRRRWYLSRTVLTCPRCAQAVRHSKTKEAWLLLVLPLLLALVFEGYATRVPLVAYVVLVLIAVGGVVMFRVTTRLEKEYAI